MRETRPISTQQGRGELITKVAAKEAVTEVEVTKEEEIRLATPAFSGFVYATLCPAVFRCAVPRDTAGSRAITQLTD